MVPVVFKVVFHIYSEDVLKKRWKNLRDGMMKFIKKIDAATRSGSGSSRLPTCKYFESLLFIRDTVSNKPTESNLHMPTANQNSVEYPPGLLEQNAREEIHLSPSSPTPSLTSNSSNHTVSSQAASSKKRKREEAFFRESKERRDKLDTLITKVFDEEKHTEVVDDDPELLFCKSLAPTLRRLDNKNKMMAQIEIQQVLLKYEFDT